jgi:DNA polymerase-3 subunit delta'
MPFSDVLHQADAQDRLQRALQSGRLPHAYIFSGPDGVGKEMLATRLAAILLCAEPREVSAPGQAGGSHSKEEARSTDERPRAGEKTGLRSTVWRDACQECDDCRLLGVGNHPDFHRIYRTLNKLHPDRKVQVRKALDLSVDVIRHFLIAKIGLRPSRGRAKVFVVAEAQRLSTSAQNALLKTLEEPPGHSYLVLLATSADALLPTIQSRCHEVAFRRLPTEFVIEQLAGREGVSPESTRLIAELSQGALGEAVRYAETRVHLQLPAVLEALRTAADDPLGCGKALSEAAKALAGPADPLPSTAGADPDDGGDKTRAARQGQSTILALVSTVLRDVQRIVVGHPPAVLPKEPIVAALAEATSSEAVGGAIRAMSAAEYQINHGANAVLVFDAVGIKLGRGLAPAAAG